MAGDALPDGGTVSRGVTYNIFWDVDDATQSVEKMLDTSQVFYPGHDRPFRLDGDQITFYLEGPLRWKSPTAPKAEARPRSPSRSLPGAR